LLSEKTQRKFKSKSEVTHCAINDVVAQSLSTVGVPVAKEARGLTGTDDKRPHGLTLTPVKAGNG